jgi:hypothetical protein
MTDFVASGAASSNRRLAIGPIWHRRAPRNGKRRRRVRRMISRGRNREIKSWKGGLECPAAAASASTIG